MPSLTVGSHPHQPKRKIGGYRFSGYETHNSENPAEASVEGLEL